MQVRQYWVRLALDSLRDVVESLSGSSRLCWVESSICHRDLVVVLYFLYYRCRNLLGLRIASWIHDVWHGLFFHKLNRNSAWWLHFVIFITWGDCLWGIPSFLALSKRVERISLESSLLFTFAQILTMVRQELLEPNELWRLKVVLREVLRKYHALRGQCLTINLELSLNLLRTERSPVITLVHYVVICFIDERVRLVKSFWREWTLCLTTVWFHSHVLVVLFYCLRELFVLQGYALCRLLLDIRNTLWCRTNNVVVSVIQGGGPYLLLLLPIGKA